MMSDSIRSSAYVELLAGAKVPKIFGKKSILYRPGDAGMRRKFETLAARPGASPLFGVRVQNDGHSPVQVNACRVTVSNATNERSVQLATNSTSIAPGGLETFEIDGQDVIDLMNMLRRSNPNRDMTIKAQADLGDGSSVESENLLNILADE
jgi:hypothetical protein